MSDIYDITLRNCGAVGWLGILVRDGKEVFRTGKHWPTAEEALTAVQLWINPI